jgi:hypothetical protein
MWMVVIVRMNTGQTVFAQIMARIPHWEFQRAYRACGARAPRSDALSPWDQFLALCFAQLTFRQSLRDIEACLRAQPALAYHLGFRAAITRSALARANEQRDWQPWATLARKLMPEVRALYQGEPTALEVDVPVIAIDSSLIDLSLALCPWANFTGAKAALKLHTALDLRGPVPAFVNVTSGETSDMGGLDDLPVEPGTLYVMDRGYIDFHRLRRLADQGSFFVIRARPDVRFYVRASRAVDRSGSLRADQIVRFNGSDVPAHWPGDLRRVTLYDAEHARRLALWTNLWDASAAVVAEAYRQRWQIELFFRWLKHGLRIQTFFGTSDNAVRLQLWASICVYLAMATARKQLGITTNLTTFVQVLSLHALSKTPLAELFAETDTSKAAFDIHNQLSFNYFN